MTALKLPGPTQTEEALAEAGLRAGTCATLRDFDGGGALAQLPHRWRAPWFCGAQVHDPLGQKRLCQGSAYVVRTYNACGGMVGSGTQVYQDLHSQRRHRGGRVKAWDTPGQKRLWQVEGFKPKTHVAGGGLGVFQTWSHSRLTRPKQAGETLTSLPSDPLIPQMSFSIPTDPLSMCEPLRAWEPLLFLSNPSGVPVLSCLHLFLTLLFSHILRGNLGIPPVPLGV